MDELHRGPNIKNRWVKFFTAGQKSLHNQSGANPFSAIERLIRQILGGLCNNRINLFRLLDFPVKEIPQAFLNPIFDFSISSLNIVA